MTIAYIALGSNLGRRQLALRTAIERLRQLPATQVVAVASFRETQPVDAPPGSRPFMNSAVALNTALDPDPLLSHLLQIERDLGRTRAQDPDGHGIRNTPRTIDLDLLMWGDRICSTGTLTLPHPRMHVRRFVLEPLAEIAPDVVHPSIGKTIGQLLTALDAPVAGHALAKKGSVP